MTDAHLANARHRPASPPAGGHYVVHLVDDVDADAAGREGCEYTSPPHAAAHALELARALLGCPTPPPAGHGPWSIPIAGGRRTVTIMPVDHNRHQARQATAHG